MTQEYADYLQTAEWKERRIKCMARVGNRCEACGQKPPLDIHHLTYARIFKEPLEDLMALCRPHHDYIEMLIADGKITRYGDVTELRKRTLELLCGYSTSEMIQRNKKAKKSKKKEKQPKGHKLTEEQISKFFDLKLDDFRAEMNRQMRSIPNKKHLIGAACLLWQQFHDKNPVAPTAPVSTTADKNVESVRTKLQQRMETGLRKYGVTTERTDLSRKQWLIHAQEEALDLAVYLENLIQQEP